MTSESADRSERERSRRSHRRETWWQALTPGGRITVAVVGGLLAAVVVFGGGDLIATAGRINPGVRIGDVAVGMMTPADAAAKITSVAPQRLSAPVTVRSGSATWKVTAEDAGAKVDSFASVERAMAVGRTGGLGEMVGARIAALFVGRSAPAKVDGDPDKMGALLDKIAEAVDVPARDATVSITGVSVKLVRSLPGVQLQKERASADILSAFFVTDRSVRLVTSAAPVHVTDADAQRALQDAERLISGPVTVLYGTQSHTVPRPEVAKWIVFWQQPADGSGAATSTIAGVPPSEVASIPGSLDASASTPAYARMVLVAGFDPARIGSSLGSFTGKVGRPAIDAQFITKDGHVSIKPGQTGLGPDLETLASELVSLCVSGKPRIAKLQLTEVQPVLTTAVARSMGVAERLGTFTTTYSSGNPQRVSNVHLLASALNNKMVPPGGLFSFNQAVGERTAAKGYQEAPAIVNGKLVPQLGGGICQCGTTIFNAVFFSGLPIVERRNHSFYISHYPKGRDCTVSWGGPDFKFRNDTKGWLLIRTSFTNSSLTVSLYGTDPGYTVDYTTSAFTNIVPHTVKETKDPTLPAGARLVSDPGVDGCNVTVVRTVYKGGQVVRTDTFVSHYNPKEEAVRVGTKSGSKPATGTPSP